MESGIIAVITLAIQNGLLTDTSLLLLIILLVGLLYKYVFKPIQKKLKSVPDAEAVKEIVEESKQTDEEILLELLEKLNQLSNTLDEVQDLGRGNYRESKELKRDVERIKQILDQFQGHLMYSGKTRDLGNRELK